MARQDHEPTGSVVGTIDIDPGDPTLTKADQDVGAMFVRSLGRPLALKEASLKSTVSRRATKKRRGW